jgi:hypothetical protein
MLAKPTLWIESTTWLRGTTSTAGLACGTGPPREALRDWNRTMTTVVSRMSLTARQEKPPRPPHNAAHRSSQQARPQRGRASAGQARTDHSTSHWTGILDSQGRGDGGQ